MKSEKVIKKDAKGIIRDHRGLSFVEVLCAIAILAMVSGIIAGVLVATSKHYRNGTKETAVQQEAQLAVNRIGDIIKDAVSVEFTGDVLTIKNGDDWYTVTRNAVDNKLNYTQHLAAGAGSDATGVLAENITAFDVDTTNFKKNRTVKVGLTVDDGEKSYAMAYNMSARNEMTTDTIVGEAVRTASILVEHKIIMVPGESGLILNVQAKGCAHPLIVEPGAGVSASISDTNDALTISLDSGITAEKTTLTLKTDTAAGDPEASVQIVIQVRRIKKVEVKYGYDSSSGEKLESDSEYTFYGRIKESTPYLSKVPGTSWDSAYKNPRAIEWSYDLYKGGEIHNELLADYFYMSGGYPKVESDSDKPFITFKMKKPLDSNMYLKVTGQSMHANGMNKAGFAYDSAVKASAILKPDLKISDNEIALDPTETGNVKLAMRGGSTSNIECILVGNSDSSTRAEFNTTTGCVDITLGKNERGSGTTPSDPKEKFTFAIDVMDKNKGEKKATITVHVKRVDKINLDKVDNKDGSYTFTTRFNADRGASLEEVESNSIYLINNKYNPYGENRTPFTLGVVYKFQVQVNGNKTDLGYIVSRATCTTEPNAASNMWFGEFKPFNNDNGYIKFEGYPASHSAAVTGEDTDDSHLTELPTLKIRKTGKKFEKITVTAIAFHVLGAEKGKDYMSDAPGIFSNRASYGVIQDEQVILGEREELIVVEPGQGTNDPNQSDEEMAIPIEASGAYKMTAVISGNSSKDTKLSDYSAQGKDNPFSNDNKTWYLGLIIGKDEKGKNGSGTFTLTVTAYGSDNDVLETFNYNIAVRRVTKAKIEATAENADQGAVVIQDDNGNKYLNYAYNKANSKITLSATVTGLCGTEYFDIQKDGNGTIKSWEKEGHGKYRTPYSIKWSIYDKKGKELNLSDYFESVPTMIDVPAEGVTKSTITFTLKKALPKGTTIKATSLHAKGQYNDSKTNKSGKEYDNVYAILKIDILDPDDPVDDDIQYLDGLLRGEDFIDFPDQKPSYRPNGGHWFWRKREITNVIVHEDGTQETTYGPWEEYHYMWENSDYKKINAVESRSLLCDKRYQIQMAYMKIDQGNRKVIWPHDSKLVAAGSDSGFAGYSMDWPSTEADTPESEYSVKYNIGRGSMTFAANPEYPITFAHYGDAVKNWESETWNEAPVFYKSFGTLEEPVALQSGGSLKVNVYGYALKSRYYQQISYARLQKLENNTWVSVNPTDICENIQDRSSFVFIKNVKSDAKKGIYRISFRVTKEGSGFWSKWNGSIWEPQYPDMSNTNYLACGSNGASGYIYIEIK